MPNLKSRTRLQPYSTQPGVAALIPGSPVSVRLFPLRAIGTDLLSGETLFDIPLEPPRTFRVVQDIERRRLVIPNHLTITHTLDGVRVGERLFSAPLPFAPGPKEKLFLGCHKAQDIDMMRRRALVHEFLPFIHGLGVQIPHLPGSCSITLDALVNLFKTAFEGLFSPLKGDPLHSGYGNPATESPLLLLRAIADLAFDSKVHHCGRYEKNNQAFIWSTTRPLQVTHIEHQMI